MGKIFGYIIKNRDKVLLLAAILFASCSQIKPSDTRFTLLDAEKTGVDFVNVLEFDEEFNIYTYRNYYNGGGVGLGDINNDGLIDIYMISNLHSNKLYLNKGEFKFEDITESAGVEGTRTWATGISIADVNGDGWLDIYVCNSGDLPNDDKKNELFINNGDLTFTERASEYGIADRGFSTHGAFFDYDRDGDLDLYLLNNSYKAIGSFNLRENERPIRDSIGGDKLYRNDTPLDQPVNLSCSFTDVSVEAGIYGSVIGFGLGVTVGDIDKDGWEDIYVSNDFFERDYIYMNNQDGTFRETLTDMMRSTSAASMGADMADINNDGHVEFFVTEMLPDDEFRIKTVTTFEDWDTYQYKINNDYYYQFTRNMLHLNHGDGTFSEIGRLLDVHATDWSWGALIWDMDNDGHKDLFVANGIFQDLTDQDFLDYISAESTMRMIIAKDGVDYKQLVDAIPSEKISNYAFNNLGNFDFPNKAAEWGLDEPSFSNGSAYGDLDNDGDLDLVVNNVNMPLFIYRNNTNDQHPDIHWIKFDLKGEGKNPFALGTKITIKAGGQLQYLEQLPVRGFESTVDHRPNFGLGTANTIDTLFVEWPNGKSTLKRNVPADQIMTLRQEEGKDNENPFRTEKVKPLFSDITKSYSFDYKHIENLFIDFDRDKLLFHMRSSEGPGFAVGDVNGDGLDDVYAGGALGYPGTLYLQNQMGIFLPTNRTIFHNDRGSEDTDAMFFDADGDGDLDLYVASGGIEFGLNSRQLGDRLYINVGKGKLEKSENGLPAALYESTSCVASSDFDGDGDQDLFVGIRFRSGMYGVPASSYLLLNDGLGNFRIDRATSDIFRDIGMVTDATWSDTDGDGDNDLIVLGEWMPITVFINENGKFINYTKNAGLSGSNGWWYSLEAADLDQDGDIDFIIGNHGLNSRFKASPERPVKMYVSDFDHNSVPEQIICVYNGDDTYPLALKHDLLTQLPGLRKKYPRYIDYGGQTIHDIFTKEQLEDAVYLEVFELRTSLLINEGENKFQMVPLPKEAQFSTVCGISVEDYDKDGIIDILLGGNLGNVKPEVGRYDASYGLFLKGIGNLEFQPVSKIKSGISFDGEVRKILPLKTKDRTINIIVRNNDSPLLYGY